MWSRKRLDISWWEIGVGLGRNLLPASRTRWLAALEKAIGTADQTFACLSVRTGFDLILQSLQLPAGSEIIFSAVTIHDMPRLAEQNGLVAVPADLDLETMAPSLATLERACTPNTKALVIAHLFGSRIDLTPIVEFARKHNLLLIEDCAQAYDGREFSGDSRADVSMFSFGTIKSATAMGGAVFWVRKPELLAAMRALHAPYPPAGRWWYEKRLVKNSLLKALTLRPCYSTFVHLCRMMGKDYDHIVNSAVRGFPGPELLKRLRLQPPGPMVALLHRRLVNYQKKRLDIRSEIGRRLAERLAGHYDCPAIQHPHHNFWVFPILSADPAGVIRHLVAAGFDATQGQSLCAVPAPAGREHLAPKVAQRFLNEVVFLPIYPELPAREIDRMADTLLAYASVPAAEAKPGLRLQTTGT